MAISIRKREFLSGSIPSYHKGSLKADVNITSSFKKKKYPSKN